MFTDLPNLAAQRLGAEVIAANDEFFAPKEALLKVSPPEWREGVYTSEGKWMDGWETRRRRTPGHDWAIVRLGLPGIVRGVVIDTAFFTGNFPEQAGVEACALPGAPSLGQLTSPETRWDLLLAPAPLQGNCLNSFAIAGAGTRVTHLRLNIFPDGGVARLRAHGEAVPDESIFHADREVDLAAMENGGVVVGCSDMHYGQPQNLIQPGRSTYMGDGWETRRRRGPGHDWSIVRLARRGVISRAELDTDHYKGNAPGSCMLEYCDAGPTFDPESAHWQTLVPEAPLTPDAPHRWEGLTASAATHLRLNIYPDGGVARLRLFGRVLA
jgi:allantoicase